MPLCEHAYCVAVACKMTERVEQWICIRFCVKLEHSSVETIQVMYKAAAMGNWWSTASSLQRACSGIMSHAEVFGETSNHPGDSAQIWHPVTSSFSQNKNHLWKARDFRLSMRFRKIRWGSWWQLGELCEVPKCLLWRGLRHHCPMYSFLVSSSINVSIFHSAWLDTFWTDLIYTLRNTLLWFCLYLWKDNYAVVIFWDTFIPS